MRRNNGVPVKTMSLEIATSFGDFAIAHCGNNSHSLMFVSRTVVTLYPCFNKFVVRALPEIYDYRLELFKPKSCLKSCLLLKILCFIVNQI